MKINSFLRKAALLSGGSAAGHLVTLAVSPLLTRIYGPQEFGSLGLFTSFLSVSGVAVTLQYEASILSAADEKEAAHLALGAAAFGIPTSFLAGLSLWLLIHYSLLGFGKLAWWVPIALSLAMCFVGYFVILRYWCLRKQNFRDISQTVFVQNAARAILPLLGGMLGLRDAGLILGETLGRGVGMGRMFRSAWPDLRSYARAFQWHDCAHALWKYRKFPLLSLPSTLIDAACVSLTVPLLIQHYGATSGGCYALVWRVLSLPTVLITLAVADTFHSHIAEQVRESPGEVLPFFLRSSLLLLGIGLIPSAILLLWARPVFTFALGAQWAVSGTMAALIVPWFLGQFVVSPLSRTVFVLSGQEAKLFWDVLCLASIPAVFYAANMRGLTVLQAITLLSLVNTALYAVYFLVLLRLIWNFHSNLAAPRAERLAG